MNRCHILGVGPFFVLLCLLLCGGSGIAREATRVPAADMPADPCLAFSMPDKDEIFAAPKRIFAHYFDRFPLSIDGKPFARDYYARQYLLPEGENGKWLAQGGYLRSRPLPLRLSGKSAFALDNMKTEIRLALARGISGFTFDILGPQDVAPDGYLARMLQAARAVDPRFTIVLMPDMAALGKNTDAVVKIIESVYGEPGLYHLDDGQLVVAPFLSESVGPESWKKMVKRLSNDGKPVAFFPTFLSVKPQYFAQYASFSRGLGVFGTPYPGNRDLAISADRMAAHAAHLLFMAGIAPQGYRPKNFLYWESEGSVAYRRAWQSAIDGQADWVQLTTWNDFSESTQLEPYTDAQGASGTGYYDLTGYYAAWFITGKAPPITHDVLYYFYRKEPVGAAAARTAVPTVTARYTEPGVDVIDVVAFTTQPAVVSVEIGGQVYGQNVSAGMHDLRIPLRTGTPRFILTRGGKTIISFTGNPPIAGAEGLSNGYKDLTYWSGSASATGVCTTKKIWTF